MDTRRFAIILLLSSGVMLAFFLYTNYTNKPKDDSTDPAAQTQPAAASQPADTGTASQPAVAASRPGGPASQPSAASQPAGKRWWIGQESRELADLRIGSVKRPTTETRKDSYLIELQLDPRGAGIAEARLAEFFETVEDKQAWQKAYDKIGDKDAWRADPNAVLEGGRYRVIRELERSDRDPLHAMTTETIRLSVGSGDKRHEVYRTDHANGQKWQLAEITAADGAEQTATFEWNMYRGTTSSDAKPFVTIRKLYTVARGTYSVQVRYRIVNHTEEAVHVEIAQYGTTDLNRLDVRSDMRSVIAGRMEDDKVKAAGQLQLAKLGDVPENQMGQFQDIGTSRQDADPVLWVGMVNKFFGSYLYLRPGNPDYLLARDYDALYQYVPIQGPYVRHVATRVTVRDITVSAGENNQAELGFDLYAGPKDRQTFKNSELYSSLHYGDTVVTRGCWCQFEWLSSGLMWLLGIFANYIFFGNYGLAIMLLVLIVSLVLHPLTKKGQISMMQMQKQAAILKPKMEEIKKKYANDAKKKQEEMFKLQREHMDPRGQLMGCLPMLLNMPIWIALYSGLNTEVALRHAAFLPVWITDLAAPDALISWSTPFNIPLLGGFTGPIVSLNLLPLILTGLFFVQMKTQPQVNPSPEQEQQRKMMMFMMPGMMLLFFYNAPSGLTMYIMVSNAWRTFEQRYIRKHIDQYTDDDDNGDTVVRTGGKGPRSSRPKKPKGPMWVKRG